MRKDYSVKSVYRGWLSALIIKPSKILKLSVIILILANLVPIFGVLFFGWEIFPIMALFWVETLIIAVLTIFKMILASPGNIKQWLEKLILVPFFCIQYGFFIIICGLAIYYLFGGDIRQEVGVFNWTSIHRFIIDSQLIWAILALILSRCFSLAANYIGRGEYKHCTLTNLMYQPYGRIAMMEVIIIFTGFIVSKAGSPAIGLILLVLLKTYLDVQGHISHHSNFPDKDEAPMSEQE